MVDELVELRKLFDTIWQVGDPAWERFVREVRRQSVPRGTFYIRIGDVSSKIGFVYSGLMRAFYNSSDGSEYIHAFIPEGQPCTSYPSYLANQPVAGDFEALEDSVLYEMPIAKFRALFELFPEWNHIGRILVEQQYVSLVQRVNELLTCTAEERFELFMKRQGELMPRLKQIHVARYLGISAEALSRLRAKRVKG